MKNSLGEAIRRRRMSKSQDVDTMNDSQLESMNKETEETGLAPDIKDRGIGEGELEFPPGEDSESLTTLRPTGAESADDGYSRGEQLRESDQEKMYSPGDENMKGFMGKAARKMKEKFGR